MERKVGWLGFPGFLRYYAIFHVMVFILQFIRPGIGTLLDFDKERIMAGEVWRLFTFVFATSGNMGFGALTIMFFFFGILLIFLFSDSLEGGWGTFRTSMYCYVGWFTLLVANFVGPASPGSGDLLFYSSVFLAFATLFPKYELRIYFILPVQVRWLAILQVVLMIFAVIKAPLLLPFYLLAHVNYILFAGIPALRGQVTMVKAMQRRRAFKASAPESGAFHTCKVCGRTDVTHPALEFRIGEDGEDYCQDHLPSGER